MATEITWENKEKSGQIQIIKKFNSDNEVNAPKYYKISDKVLDVECGA